MTHPSGDPPGPGRLGADQSEVGEAGSTAHQDVNTIDPEGSKQAGLPRRWLYVIGALAVVAAFGAGYFTHALVGPSSSEQGDGRAAAGSATSGNAAAVNPIGDEDPFIGPEDAPVTVIEYSDFQCPFCKRFHEQTLGPLLSAYEGRIQFVFRDFPLVEIHPYARLAAEAGECANEQGAFWPMHDRLFADLAIWGRSPDVASVFKGFAMDMSLDAGRFDACLDERRYAHEVAADFQAGRASGVTGTPTFFINGRILKGARPLEAFQQMIDEELVKAGP